MPMEPSATGEDRPVEHHHRDIQGGAARAGIFGVSDGLVSNVALVLGVAGATPAPGIVRLAGLAGLVGGAFSMAAGEFVSMRAQQELLERELDMERTEIHRRPEYERRELAALYRSRGMEADTADSLATEVHRDPQIALETHAREELGIDPTQLGNPTHAAVTSFCAFAFGALVPLAPWFVARGTGAVLASIALGLVTAIAVGVALARFTGRSSYAAAARQLLFTAVPAAVTFAIGSLVGLGTSVS
ncbi:MAG TPA: VIT1/CCC1 transporter family protein [Acidimicrobiales bacterium]|nr:VIT1/CCC1 transporter family protein [Acidimicrobiales bacterium]